MASYLGCSLHFRQMDFQYVFYITKKVRDFCGKLKQECLYPQRSLPGTASRYRKIIIFSPDGVFLKHGNEEIVILQQNLTIQSFKLVTKYGS